jgi:hypothetical protein
MVFRIPNAFASNYILPPLILPSSSSEAPQNHYFFGIQSRGQRGGLEQRRYN